MPVVGRKPKPEGQAVNRHKPVTDWVEVPEVPFTAGPKLPSRQPSGRPWQAWTKRWWGTISAMPHCVLWTDADWEFAFASAAVHAQWVEQQTSSAAVELRNREKVLGTTLDYRRDLRIRYVPVKAEDEGPAGVARLDDYRDL